MPWVFVNEDCFQDIAAVRMHPRRSSVLLMRTSRQPWSVRACAGAQDSFAEERAQAACAPTVSDNGGGAAAEWDAALSNAEERRAFALTLPPPQQQLAAAQV